jgi:hypothetical protein
MGKSAGQLSGERQGMEARKCTAILQDETGQGDRTWHSQAWNVLRDKQAIRQDKAAGRNKDTSTRQDREIQQGKASAQCTARQVKAQGHCRHGGKATSG